MFVTHQKNHLGKSLIDYAIESNDPYNLKALIVSFGKYHKYFDHELQIRLEMSMFEYYLKLIITHHDDDNLIKAFFDKIVSPLLGELKGKNLPLDKIMSWSDDDDYGTRWTITNEIDSKTLQKSKFHADKLICLMIAYSDSSTLSPKVRDFLMKAHPVFEQMLNIVDGREDELVNNFKNSMKLIESFCYEKYEIDSDTFNGIGAFQSIMFTAAIIHDKRRIIDLIAESHMFSDVELILPKDMELYDSSDHATLKILENRCDSLKMKSYLPYNAMTSEVFKQFLNSRLSKSDDGDRIKIDTSFLVGVEGNQKDSCYNTEPLKYITSHIELKKHLTHPAITSYIDLKFNMYKKIFFWNFWSFFILTVIYFWNACDIIGKQDYFYYTIENAEEGKDRAKLQDNFDESVFIIVCIMICKELIQIWIVGSIREHYRDFTNKLELALILLLSLTTTLEVVDQYDPAEVVFLTKASIDSHEFQTTIFINLTCVNILIMTALLMTMLPYDFMYQNMLLFKKVGKTFIKFLFTFMSILTAFVYVFMIVFYPKNDSLKESSSTIKNSTKTEEETHQFPKHFDVENVGVAIVKVILMMAGGYDANLLQLQPFQLTIFFMFVIVSFICLNLIVGLTIDDVKVLKEEALRTSVTEKIRKIIQINENFARLRYQMKR